MSERANHDSLLTLSEREAQRVLLVASVEAQDADGRLLPHAEREQATTAARDEVGEDDPTAMLTARAERLFARLEERAPSLRRVLRVARLVAGAGPVVLGVAVLAGLGTQLVAEGGMIHLLSAPLLGLLAWNVLVYVVLAVAWLRALLSRGGRSAADDAEGGGDDDGWRARGGGVVRALSGWLVERAAGRARARQADDQALLAKALGRFAARWRRVAGALLAWRLGRLLHLGALVMILGSVAGLYLRGVALQYRVGWESTFLDAEAVHAVLRVVLGPAAALLGETLPDVAALEALRTGADGPASEDAARWIHLYAVTAGLWVVLPRLLLAGLSHLRVARLSRSLRVPVDGSLLRHVLAPTRTRSRRVVVHPYALSLEPRQRDALVVLLHDVFGLKAEVRVNERLSYGDDAPAPDAGDDDRCDVLLFGLASSPEVEVHGDCARDLHAAGGRTSLVLIDGSGYRKRLGDDATRLDERRRAWDRVLQEREVPAAHVDLGRSLDDATVAAVSAAVVQPGAAAEAVPS